MTITRKRRKRNDYFSTNIGREDDDIFSENMKALEINSLNPVHLEVMHGFGYRAYGVSYIPSTIMACRNGLSILGLDKNVKMKKWDGHFLPFKDAEMSMVIAGKAGYYQPNQNEFAKEVGRIVKPGGEIFLFYLSSRHSYCRYLDQVKGNIFQFNEQHPNPKLVGAYVFFASPLALEKIWRPWFKVEIKYFEFNTWYQFSSFYVVTGIRNKARVMNEG